MTQPMKAMKPDTQAGHRAMDRYAPVIVANGSNGLDRLRRNARRAGWDMKKLEEDIARIQRWERAIAEHVQKPREGSR